MVAVLRYLLLGFAAFAVAAILAHPDWPELARATLAPALSRVVPGWPTAWRCSAPP